MSPLFLAVFFILLCSALSEQNPETICPEPEIISPCTCSKSCPVCSALIKCKNILNIAELDDVFRKSTDYTFWNFYIEDSSLLYIPSDAIVEKKVRRLFLRGNVMTSLFDTAPPPSNMLQELELTNLRLQVGMRWELLSSLVHLKELNLTQFELNKIDQSFVNNFPRGLTGLFFTDTKTKVLGDTVFARLTELTRIFVRQTQISRLARTMFPENSKLIAMHFTGNQISSLPTDLFTNMPELQGIGFSDTQIVSLPESVFGNIMPRLGLLYMENNAMDCNCQMKWITELRVFPYYLKVTCTIPTAVAGLSIKELKPKHFLHCE